MLAHIVPFCEENQCGLTRFAEQTGEAIHSKFKPTWTRYKRNVSHKDHGKNLHKAVSDFSSRRR